TNFHFFLFFGCFPYRTPTKQLSNPSDMSKKLEFRSVSAECQRQRVKRLLRWTYPRVGKLPECANYVTTRCVCPLRCVSSTAIPQQSLLHQKPCYMLSDRHSPIITCFNNRL